MSVYKPPKSRFWQYDFVYKGRRFHGSTGVETRRRAEGVERKVRQDAVLGIVGGGMTLNQAAGKWWAERGAGLKSAVDRERAIALLLKLLGPDTLLTEVTTAKVSDAIERRRGMAFQRASGRAARRYLPKAATVNRDVIDTLRPILKRARRTWEITGLPEIDWASLRLAEPKPRPLEFTAAELDLIRADMREHWADFVRFLALYGPRLSEMFFGLDDLDLADRQNARVTLRDRKGGDDHVIPLLPEDAAMLAARAGRAREAGLDTVWFRQVGRKAAWPSNRPPKLRALTYHGAAVALRRAMARTGLRATKGAKGAHGLRHHAGMRILRGTGNLRLAQDLLGHASIQSTLVYAHAVEEDLRKGLAAVSRNSPEPVAEAAPEVDTDQRSKA